MLTAKIQLDGVGWKPVVAYFWSQLLFGRGQKSQGHETHGARLENGPHEALECNRWCVLVVG